MHLGTPIEPGFPAILQSGRRSASRYLYCFLVWLEFAKEKTGRAAFDQLEELILANYGQDVLKNQPVLIMVQDLPMEYILAKSDFFGKYMAGYTMIGKTAGHTIYKLTGSQRVFAESEMVTRQKLVISILAGEKTIDQVVTEGKWVKHRVELWVKEARRGVVEAVTMMKRLADKKQELYDDNKRLSDRVGELNQDNLDLKVQIEMLQNEKGHLLPEKK